MHAKLCKENKLELELELEGNKNNMPIETIL